MSPRRPERRAADRGVVSVLSVFFVLLLLTILAVAINMGRLFGTRGDLQHAADSAALAGVEILEVKLGTGGMGGGGGGGTGGGRELADFDRTLPRSVQAVARRLAQSYSIMDGIGQRPSVNIASGQDVKFGFWHWKDADEPCAYTSGTCSHGWELAPAQSPSTAIDFFLVNAISVTTKYQLATVLDGVLGRGDTNMVANAIAAGRRSRVKCALPMGLSTRHGGTPTFPIIDTDAAIKPGLNCNATNFHFVGVNTCSSTLARIDVTDTAPAGDMKDFVRSEIYDRCGDDPASQEYVVGAATAPTPGLADNDLRPIIEGLLGIATAGGAQTPGRCMLGQQIVLPVVNVPLEDQACPPVATSPWPPDSNHPFLVVGFVNAVVLSVVCADTTTLLPANCENPVAAQACSGGYVGPPDPDLALNMNFWCDRPTGPGNNYDLALRPRLVR